MAGNAEQISGVWSRQNPEQERVWGDSEGEKMMVKKKAGKKKENGKWKQGKK